MQQQIHLDALSMDAFIGILDHEKAHSQPISISLVLDVDYYDAAISSDLNLSVDYFELSQAIDTFVTSKHTDLLETLIHEVSALVFSRYALVSGLSIRIDKPRAVPTARTTALSLQLSRHEFDTLHSR